MISSLIRRRRLRRRRKRKGWKSKRCMISSLIRRRTAYQLVTDAFPGDDDDVTTELCILSGDRRRRRNSDANVGLRFSTTKNTQIIVSSDAVNPHTIRKSSSSCIRISKKNTRSSFKKWIPGQIHFPAINMLFSGDRRRSLTRRVWTSR